jgi:hypothetical protein
MLARIEADPDAGTIFSLYQYAIVVTLANPLIHAVMTQDVRVLGDFTRRWIRANGSRADDGNLFRDEMVRHLQEANVIRADLDAKVVSYIMGLIRYGFLTVHDVIPPEQTPPLDEVGRTLGLLLERALEPEGGGDKEAGKQVLMETLEGLHELVRRFREKR